MVVLHWLLFEAIFHFFNFKFDLYVGLSDLESKKKKKTTLHLHYHNPSFDLALNVR